MYAIWAAEMTEIQKKKKNQTNNIYVVRAKSQDDNLRYGTRQSHNQSVEKCWRRSGPLFN